jgi:NitT/TauT family transport system substrate-binding protein
MRVVLLCTALIVAAAPGCRRADAPGTVAARPKVRVSLSPHLSSGPLMIAQAEGFFADEGLDVEFVSSLRSEESLAALVTGDIDVRSGPLHAGVLSAIAQGARLRVTAGQGELARDACTYFAIVVRPGIDPAAKGAIKRMRTSQDGVARFLVSEMLAPHGIDVRSIETIRLPEAAMVNSLERGSIDAVAVSEPVLTRLGRSGRVWVRAEDVVPNFQWGALVFGPRLLDRDRDVGVRFIRAYNRGVRRYMEGKTDRNVAIIAEASGTTVPMTRDACWLTFRPGSAIDWKSIAEFQRWANAHGLMEHTLTRDQVWDSTFVTADSVRLATTTP